MSAVPKLRFPEFETAYAFRYLGDEVAKISSGKTKAESDGKYELYGSTGVIGKTNSPECHGQNILIARVGANAGALNIVEGSYGVTDNTLILSAAETSCLNFIFYFLKSFNLNRLVFGSGQPLVTGGMIKKLKFSRPSLPEQQKIASFLSSVDKKIDLLRQKKDALELYKKGLMQKIFSQEIRFKQDDGSDFPEWEEVALGEHCAVTMGQSPSSEGYNDQGNGIPLIQGNADIKSRLTCPQRYTTVCTKQAQAGDIIICVRAPIGLVSICSERSCLGRGVAALRVKEKIQKNYLFHYLIEFEGRWIRIGQGSTFTAINGADITGLLIPLPALHEQEKIASFLSNIDIKIQGTSSQIEQMETFKKGLLQQMFV